YADVVGPGAGEVLQRRAPRFGLDHAEVHLHAATGADGRLGRAAADDLDGVRMTGEGGHEGGGVLGGGQDVDVADRVAYAAERAGVRAFDGARDLGEVGDEFLGQLHRDVDEDAAFVAAQQFDAVQDVLGGLRAEAGH